MKVLLCASFCASTLAFAATDWSNAIDFKSDRVIFSAVKSKDTFQSEAPASDATWFPVTTLPDVILDHASSFLQRETESPDQSLYGFQWATISKGQLDHKNGATQVDGTEYLIYRVPMDSSNRNLERDAHRMPATGDGYEYAVVKPDTMQILNTGLKGPEHQGSLKRTPTLRMTFKPIPGVAAWSSFLQAEAQVASPLRFGDWKAYESFVTTAHGGAKKADLEKLDTLETQMLETETETEMVPIFGMFATSIQTGMGMGQNYNTGVMNAHAAAEDSVSGAVNGVAQATGHPVAHGVAAVHQAGSNMRKGVVQAVGNTHNAVLGAMSKFTEAWVPKAQ